MRKSELEQLSQNTQAFFKLRALVKQQGMTTGTLESQPAYSKLVDALEAYGRLIVDEEYPKLKDHATTIGFGNISKQMIANYK